MSKLHTTWHVRAETLSPLHIGSGTELMLGHDLVAERGQTYRINETALLEAMLLEAEAQGAGAVNRVLMGQPAAKLLAALGFDDPKLFRYTLAGRPGKEEGKIPEQIKDVYDHPYLPGSSLKGALRTLLAWGMFTRSGHGPNLRQLGPRSKYAAQELERDLFGRDPNHDFLRALQVQDSVPVELADALRMEQVLVYPGGTPIDIEAVRPGLVFDLAIAVDEYGFQGQPASQLGWQGKRAWLGQLVALGREYAGKRLAAEIEFFQGHRGPEPVLAFYSTLVQQLLEGGLADDEILLQVGWGTGWESKTLGSGLIRQDDATFERLLDQYRMTKERNREIGDAFPKSRTLVLRNDEPALPLGWLRVKLEGFVPGEEPRIAPLRREERPAQPSASRRPPAQRGGTRRPTDLKPGEVLEGTVRNIASFGAFVDIGVGNDGLVHVSQLSHEYVKQVEAVVRVGQRVRVKVLSVEQQKGKWRISLSMKDVEQ